MLTTGEGSTGKKKRCKDLTSGLRSLKKALLGFVHFALVSNSALPWYASPNVSAVLNPKLNCSPHSPNF